MTKSSPPDQAISAEGSQCLQATQDGLQFEIIPGKNGQLNLFKLPRELRDEIYRYTFVDFARDKAAHEYGHTEGGEKSCAAMSFDICGSAKIQIHAIGRDMLPEIADLILNEFKVRVNPGVILRPHGDNMLQKARKLMICFDGLSEMFMKRALPILQNRNNILELHLALTRWPKLSIVTGIITAGQGLKPLASLKANSIQISCDGIPFSECNEIRLLEDTKTHEFPIGGSAVKREPRMVWQLGKGNESCDECHDGSCLLCQLTCAITTVWFLPPKAAAN